MHPHVVTSVGLRTISKSKPIKRELSTKFPQAKGCSSPDLQLLVQSCSPEKVSSAEAGGGGAGMLGSVPVAMEKGAGIICMVSNVYGLVVRRNITHSVFPLGHGCIFQKVSSPSSN